MIVCAIGLYAMLEWLKGNLNQCLQDSGANSVQRYLFNIVCHKVLKTIEVLIDKLIVKDERFRDLYIFKMIFHKK